MEPTWMIVEGSKQGKFESDESKKRKGLEGAIEVFTYEHEVRSPRDPASGHASGKRQWGAITITKPVDSTSPLFWQACVTNEELKKCELKFFRVTPSGQLEQYYSVILDKAYIASVKMIVPEQEYEGGTAKHEHHTTAKDVIQFTFQKITIEHKLAKKVMSDDWLQMA
jgi:type VI secretion system secreted protein Hcp